MTLINKLIRPIENKASTSKKKKLLQVSVFTLHIFTKIYKTLHFNS